MAPQTPERKLRVGVICERGWPGARPQGKDLMDMLCLGRLSPNSDKVLCIEVPELCGTYSRAE